MPTLTEHLTDEFAGRLSAAAIEREIRAAITAADMVRLREDYLLIVELITRHQLLIRCGEASDVARLDPQTHSRPAQA